MTLATKVTVNFMPIPRFDLVVTKAGSGIGTVSSDPGGIDCGSDCREQYREGTMVTLMASAGAKSVFAGWSGDAPQSCGTNLRCAVTMSQVTAVTATFNTIPDFSVSVEFPGDGAGRVQSGPVGINCQSGPCVAEFPKDSMVTLTAQPIGDSSFEGWGGDAPPTCGKNTTCIVAVTGPVIVSAMFKKPPKYDVVVDFQGDGAGSVTLSAAGIPDIVCSTDCTNKFNVGTVVTMTATPAPGSDLTAWGGGGASCGTTPTCGITVNAPMTVSVTISTSPVLTVSLDGNGAGRVQSQPSGIDCPGVCSAQFPSGATVALTATPTPPATFDGWDGPSRFSCANLFFPICSVTLVGGQSIVARFVEPGSAIWAEQLTYPNVPQQVLVAGATSQEAVVFAATYDSTKGAQFRGTSLPALGRDDVVLAALAPADGAVIWSKAIGGALDDVVTAAAFNRAGMRAVIVGSTSSASVDFGGPAPSSDPGNLFIASYDEHGAFLWARRYSLNGLASAVSINDAGDVAITGYTIGSLDFGDGVVTTPNGYLCLFVAKFDHADGDLVWKKVYVPTSNGVNSIRAEGTGVALDSSGNVIATGSFRDNIAFRFSPVLQGPAAFVVKFRGSDGEILWDNKFGVQSSSGTALQVDSSNAIFLLGGMPSGSQFLDIPVGGSTATNAFLLAKIMAGGGAVWALRFAGVDPFDQPGAHALALDRDENPIVGGEFIGTLVLNSFTLRARQDMPMAVNDAFAGVFATDTGTAVWAVRFGSGTGDDAVWAVTSDAIGHIISSGNFVGNADFAGRDLTTMSIGNAYGDGFVVSVVPNY
jgi:hypothetical protein